MKNTLVILFIGLLIISCKGGDLEHEKNDVDFKSERISKTASFIAEGNIKTVFPLFGAFEERKWADGWNPVLIYPEKEIIKEGTAFKHSGHGHGSESETLWIVTKYDVQTNFIQYLVSTANRFWTITVECKSIENDKKTNVTVTYAYTSLNEEGAHLNKHSLERMYVSDLKDWKKAVNYYLTTGKTLKLSH